MYTVLLPLHGLTRWLVLLLLLYSLFRSYRGYVTHSAFTATDNSVRHWTATLAHIQLVLGMILYVYSPIVKSAAAGDISAGINDAFYFRYVHIALMLLAIVLLTIGSAKAKREVTDRDKFCVILRWYIPALVIILLAVPWPFSPLSQRPYIRPF